MASGLLPAAVLVELENGEGERSEGLGNQAGAPSRDAELRESLFRRTPSGRSPEAEELR
ncbi:hypothetical protein ACFQWF_00165 [Methylorubrum suomiense]